MPGLRRITAAVLCASALTIGGVAPALADAGSSNSGSGNSAGGGGQCTVNVGGQWVTVLCGSGNGTTAATGSGGGAGHTTITCVFNPLDAAAARQLGLAWPPPNGTRWVLMQCPGGGIGAGPQAMLVNVATGAPQVSAQQLLRQAVGELRIPALTPGTAPPRGTDGLVGLPEWFWVSPAQWRPRSVTVVAGPVWATATATPERLTFLPGAALPAVSCRGPGIAYDPARSAGQQRTSCLVSYFRPSAGQPGNIYQAAVIVSWRVSWTGSAGAGGVLDASLPVAFPFAQPVAQGEALVTGP